MSADLHKALQVMNAATYAAARAARAASSDPALQARLRDLAFETDTMVDKAAPGVNIKERSLT